MQQRKVHCHLDNEGCSSQAVFTSMHLTACLSHKVGWQGLPLQHLPTNGRYNQANYLRIVSKGKTSHLMASQILVCISFDAAAAATKTRPQRKTPQRPVFPTCLAPITVTRRYTHRSPHQPRSLPLPLTAATTTTHPPNAAPLSSACSATSQMPGHACCRSQRTPPLPCKMRAQKVQRTTACSRRTRPSSSAALGQPCRWGCLQSSMLCADVIVSWYVVVLRLHPLVQVGGRICGSPHKPASLDLSRACC